MNKLLLTVGITVSLAAHSQQKELFDIPQHLDKKSAEKKGSPGRPGILQKNNPGLQAPVTGIPRQHYSLPLLPKWPENYLDPERVTIERGIIDNMPIVKPDNQDFWIILPLQEELVFNFSPDKVKPGQIPNGSKRLPLWANK